MKYRYAHRQHSYCFPRVKYTRGQSITTNVFEEPRKDDSTYWRAKQANQSLWSCNKYSKITESANKE